MKVRPPNIPMPEGRKDLGGAEKACSEREVEMRREGHWVKGEC